MSQYQVQKASLRGEVTVPPSKSHTLRAILFGALAEGKTTIRNYLDSKDTRAMVEACRLLGASLDVHADRIDIMGVGGRIESAEDVINAGNSGIVLRFCAAVAGLAARPIVVTGDHSIRHQRPMKPLLEGLAQLGVSAVSTRGDGFAPIIIQGPLKPGKAEVLGEDSQPVSALLIASAFAQGPTEIVVPNPGEKPWVALTLDWFDRLGIAYESHEFRRYRMPGGAKVAGFDYTVPGDLSSAAFPIAAALVTGSEVILNNVDMGDSQGDKELVAVFQRMGASIEIDAQQRTLYVRPSQALHGVTVDINNFVDAITILAVVACYAEGETHIKNAAVARQKECNRIQSIATELRKMGADVVELDDGLRIRKSALTGTDVHSYHDHRMVMSLTVAALGATGTTTVDPVECVSKTFPTFLRDFNALQANIRFIE